MADGGGWGEGEKAAFNSKKAHRYKRQKNDRHKSETCSEKMRRREMGEMDGGWGEGGRGGRVRFKPTV